MAKALDLTNKSQKNTATYLAIGGLLGTLVSSGTWTFNGTAMTILAVRNKLGGTSTYKLKELCQHANINEWSIFKANKVALYELGDFLGYNHNAKPPLYWTDTDKTITVDVEHGDTWSRNISLSKGDMLPTSNLNGWSPIYMQLWDGGDGEPLVALQPEVDGVNLGGLIEWDVIGSITAQGDDTDGDVILTVEYWKRSSSAGSWAKVTDNIEDGLYTIDVSQYPFAFQLISADAVAGNDFYKLFGGASEFTGITDFDIDYDFQNQSGSTQTRTIYWTIWNKGVARVTGSFSTGSKAHLAHATGTINAATFNCYLDDSSEHGYATMTFYADALKTAVLGQSETYHVEREVV